MDLFIIEDNVAKPSEHALIIEPFKTIWQEDKSKNKIDSIKAFTYIELNCSRKKSNPFIGYSDEERPSKVAEEVYKNELYTPTTLELEGIAVYNKFLQEASPTIAFYKSALKAAQELKNFYDTVDLLERTNGGSAVYKPGDITRSLKETSEVIKSLKDLEAQVQTELLEKTKTRGQRDIGDFER